ncbi:MAG: MBL fold metallo-hydrolase [Thermomicrobiales bacterium]|jgi:phosphoribosyl 1,2-cyclic phosphodiesterase|nr:MBL fold metallo-hydrolase [Thermomicrobiales bacterium]
MRVTSLASGSSGNALVVEHDGAAVLVDCGCPPRRLAMLLREAGVPLDTIAAVLITHEHSDHVLGVNVLPRRLEVPFFMTPGTRAANPYVNGAPVFERRPVIEQPPGSTWDVGPFDVTSFPVSHDGAEVCGYFIEAGGRSVAVFTDLGVAEPHLHEPLARAELLVLEANHDEQMLWRGPYPWPLKKRVASPRGHLSNAACAELLCDVLPDRGREVWLAHLSRTNNRPQIAAGEATQQLHAHGFTSTAHTVRVLPQFGSTLRWEPQALQLALGL